MVKIISKNLDIKKQMEGINLANGEKHKGSNCEYYELWDQNENLNYLEDQKTN